MRITQYLDDIRDDLKFAMRQLIGSPGFTLVAVLTLGCRRRRPTHGGGSDAP